MIRVFQVQQFVDDCLPAEFSGLEQPESKQDGSGEIPVDLISMTFSSGGGMESRELSQDMRHILIRTRCEAVPVVLNVETTTLKPKKSAMVLT